jgi:hypothetical protein
MNWQTHSTYTDIQGGGSRSARAELERTGSNRTCESLPQISKSFVPTVKILEIDNDLMDSGATMCRKYRTREVYFLLLAGLAPVFNFMHSVIQDLTLVSVDLDVQYC